MGRFLSQWGAHPETVFICPNSSFADGLPVGKDGNRVLTVSDFIRQQAETLFPDIEIIQEDWLMLSLATVFKKVCPGVRKEFFFRAFGAFKDLRSYTLDLDVVGECLGRFDDEIARAVRAFWLCVDEEGIVDEHELYRRVGQSYRDGIADGLSTKGHFVLAGFHHLTAHQIDMFKSLGLHNDVVVPVDGYVYSRSLDTDWFRWLDTDTEKGDIQEQENVRVKTVFYPKNRLAEYMANFSSDGKNFDVVLCQREPIFFHFNEIALKDVSFKYRETVFEPLVEEMFQSIKLSRSSSMQAADFADYLDGKIAANIEAQDFRRIKVPLLLSDGLKKWRELSVANMYVSDLEIEIFKKIVLFKLPKLYGYQTTRVSGAKVFGINEALAVGWNKTIVVVASSNYDLSGDGGEKYDQGTMEFLGALGPVRRPSLEALSFKKQILDLLDRATVVLFMEEGLMKEDAFWGELKDPLDFEPLQLDIPGRERRDHLAVGKRIRYTEPSYSAAKIQAYMDCPRKFYYGFIEPLPSKFRVSNDVEFSDLGTIEHKVIEAFFEDGGSLDDVVGRVLDGFLEAKGIKLGKGRYRMVFNEILGYSANGIEFVERLRKECRVTDFAFEKKINDDNFIGRADFVASSPDGEIVVDFKRSKGSVPTRKAMEDLKNIQVTGYIHHLGIPLEDVALAGFFCLAEPEKSVMLGRLEVSELGFKVDSLEGAYAESFGRYPCVEAEQIGKIKEERIFAARPVEPGVCTYCVVKQICPRGFCSNGIERGTECGCEDPG